MSRKSSSRPWIEVGRELSSSRAGILTLVSFALPLAIWSIVSYTPFIWHPDIRLELPASRADSTSVYLTGDHIGKDFFADFQEAIRGENDAIASGEVKISRRNNTKQLRQIASLAIAQKWITAEQERDSESLFYIWRDIATGQRESTRPVLSEENLEIARKNWNLLSAAGQNYSNESIPEAPLYKLVPQGRPANPDYLPEPLAVLKSGINAFTEEVEEGEKSMTERTIHSVKIVFSGFLVSCIIGIPLGMLCGSISFFSRLIEPFVDFFRYMPAPTFSTILVAILLANDAPKIALVVLGTVFQMILIIAKTTRLLDHSLLEAAQTLGATQKQLLFKVIGPGILPNLYNDLRILLGWAWTWLVIAELIGVKSGLTEFIETQGRWRNFDQVYPIIILIGLIGYFTDQFLAWLRRPLFPWLGEPVGPKSRAVIACVTYVPNWFQDAVERRQPMYPRK